MSSHSKNPSINSRFFNPRPKNNLAQNKIIENPTAENYFDGSFEQISTGSIGDGDHAINTDAYQTLNSNSGAQTKRTNEI